MMKLRLFVPVLLLLVLVAVSGCDYVTGAALKTPAALPPPSTPETTGPIKNISPREASILLGTSSAIITIIDVRTPAEFAEGHLIGAVNIDYSSADFRNNIEQLDKEARYLVYCRTGVRSAAASQIMAELGFKDIFNMTGGFTDWSAAGLPYEK